MYCMNILSCIAFYRWIVLHADVSVQEIEVVDNVLLSSLSPSPNPPS